MRIDPCLFDKPLPLLRCRSRSEFRLEAEWKKKGMEDTQPEGKIK